MREIRCGVEGRSSLGGVEGGSGLSCGGREEGVRGSGLFGEVEDGELAVVFFGGAVVGPCGVDFVFEVSELDDLAVDGDSCLPEPAVVAFADSPECRVLCWWWESPVAGILRGGSWS